MADQIDIIATRILLESQQATKALADFDSAVGKSKSRVEQLAKAMQLLKAETGRGIQDLVKSMQAMNAPKGAGQFGTLGLTNKQIADAGKLVTLFEQQATAKTKVATAAERAARAETKQASTAAQSVIPQFVQKNFGNINEYIAQSSNKIAAWKQVVTGSAKAAGVSFEQAGNQLKKMVSGTSVAPLNTAIKQLGDDGRSAFQKLTEGAHFARIALGALVSMILFNLLQAIQSTFSTALNNLQEFEATLYRISNVERELSLKGVEISVAGLKKGVQDIKALLPIFSEEDLAQMIGSLATATSHLGLQEDQILKLGKAIAILNIQSVEEETLLQTQSKIVNAIVTSQSKGLGNLGITFSKNAIEAKALELGLLKAGDAVSKLTDAQKTQAKLGIVFDKANIEASGDELRALTTYLESSDAKSQELKATWNDFLKQVGIQFAPLIIEFLQSTIDLINGWTAALEKNKPFWDFIVATLSGIQRIQHDINAENQEASGLEKWISKLVPTLGKLEDLKTKGIFDSFKEGFDEAMQKAENFGDAIETPTGAIEELYETAEDNADALEAFQKLGDAIEEVAIDARQAREDLAVSLQQKQEDVQIGFEQKNQDTELDALQKAEDAVIDYNNKVADINLDAQQKVADAKRKAREDELQAERDLVQKLKELRQRFLMDLEEALRERDARQVLRLIKEYQFDKQSLLDKKKLEDQERAAKLAADLRNIEIERQQRLESAAIDLQRRLADIQTEKQRELEENLRWRDRELEELATWHARELEEIDRHAQQKLEKLIANYAQEYGLHQQEQEKIHQLLLQYFGANVGLISSLSSYMSGLVAQMQGLSFSAAAFPTYFQSEKGRLPYAGAFAEGGAIIADKPTAAIFGEAGREMATFTPLDRGGQINPFGDVTGGVGGRVLIEMLLSPDLEARITENTLNQTADIVTRVARSK